MNARIGTLYVIGAAVVAVAGVWTRPWGWLLMWPAVSMVVVAGAYVGLYGDITRKRNGQLGFAASVVLAPWLIAQHASLIYYRRQAGPWNAAAPGVWIGRRLNECEAMIAVSQGVTAVIDLTAEFSQTPAFRSLPYLTLPILDLTAPTPTQVDAALDFINAYRRDGVVYVHCKIGYSRSAAIVGSWLIDSGLAATPEEAISRIRAARPSVVVRPEAFAAIQAFHRGGADVSRRTSSLIEVRA
jgi:protein-tyrosine phosphatase